MSITSANNTASVGVVTSTVVGLLPTPSFRHLINLKLARGNYLLRKAQFLPYLRSQQLLGYVDSSSVCPGPLISQMKETRATHVPNPAHQNWLQHDRLVLSALFSSLSENVLSQVILLSTSLEVWSTREIMFASRTQVQAQVMQIKIHLATTKKKDTAANYFNKMKQLANTLAAIAQLLAEEELITYILVGLDSDRCDVPQQLVCASPQLMR